MGSKAKSVVKAVAMAGGAVFVYVILPYLLISYVRQNFPFIELNPVLLTNILITGPVVVVFVFLLGLFASKTMRHAVAGIAYCASQALYFFINLGGVSAGAFGSFAVTFDNATLTIGFTTLLIIFVLMILLNSILYVIEFVQASKTQ